MCAYCTLLFLHFSLPRVRSLSRGLQNVKSVQDCWLQLQCGGSQRHPHFRPAGYKFGLGVPKDSLGFNNSLERHVKLTESTILKQSKKEMHREKSGKVLSSSGMCYPLGVSTCDNIPSIAPPSFSVRVFTEASWHRHAWSISGTWLNSVSSPHLSPEVKVISGGSSPKPLIVVVGLAGPAILILSHLSAWTIRCSWRGWTGITKTFQSLGNPKGYLAGTSGLIIPRV